MTGVLEPAAADGAVAVDLGNGTPLSKQQRQMRRQQMEETLRTVPPPPKPTLRRVTNDDGAVVFGTAQRRTVLLLSRASWRRLQEADDLWTWVHDKAGRLLWGAVEMQATPAGYVVTRAMSVPGSANLVKALTSGFAFSEGARRVDYLGYMMRPRRWEPLAGLRRRGERSLQQGARAHKLKPERVDVLLDRLRTAFFARPVEDLDE